VPWRHARPGITLDSIQNCCLNESGDSHSYVKKLSGQIVYEKYGITCV